MPQNAGPHCFISFFTFKSRSENRITRNPPHTTNNIYYIPISARATAVAYIKFAQHFTLCRKRAPHERTIHAGRESQSPTTADDTATRMMYECRATSADKRGRPARSVDEKGAALARCWTSARLLRANRSIHTYTHTHTWRSPSTHRRRRQGYTRGGSLVCWCSSRALSFVLNGWAEMGWLNMKLALLFGGLCKVCVYGFVRHKHSKKKNWMCARKTIYSNTSHWGKQVWCPLLKLFDRREADAQAKCGGKSGVCPLFAATGLWLAI